MKFTIHLFIFLISINLFGQTNYCEGFKNGYKNGYCHQDISCVSPPVICDTPSVNTSTTVAYGSYQHGYNDGFAKGRKDKSNSGSSSNRTGITSNINQSNLNSSSQALQRQHELEMQQGSSDNSLALLLNQIKINKEKYEKSASLNPEVDLNKGGFKKYTIRKPNKYKIKLFKSKKWNEEEVESCYASFSRNFSDNSNIYFYGLYPENINIKGKSPIKVIDSIYNLWKSSVNPTEIGINTEYISGKGLLITKLSELSFKKAGGKTGDIITMVDEKSIINNNSITEILKYKVPHQLVPIEVLRDGAKLNLNVFLSKRFFHLGKIKISNLNGFFTAYLEEYEYYGDIFTKIIVNNYVINEKDAFTFTYQITYPQNSDPEFEFEKFKNTIKSHLNSIQIN